MQELANIKRSVERSAYAIDPREVAEAILRRAAHDRAARLAHVERLARQAD
ncbi:MAG TPA: hypothetical protein VHB30_06985 [Solirubrobacteraceae bacterium]|jgi:hypothetical protein|nr:hypothetical protein [Solirubrobacteraceae bacterium]